MPRSISTTAVVYAKSWLVAVDARVSRRFLHAASAPELRMLEHLQTVLEQARAWFGAPAMQGPEYAIVSDGLVVAPEKALAKLRGALASMAEECVPSTSLHVLLHHMETHALPPEEPHDVLHGSAPATAHAWALRRPAHVCLIDEVLAIIEPKLALTPEEDVLAEVDALVIDGDPAPKKTRRPTVEVSDAGGAAAARPPSQGGSHHLPIISPSSPPDLTMISPDLPQSRLLKVAPIISP